MAMLTSFAQRYSLALDQRLIKDRLWRVSSRQVSYCSQSKMRQDVGRIFALAKLNGGRRCSASLTAERQSQGGKDARFQISMGSCISSRQGACSMAGSAPRCRRGRRSGKHISWGCASSLGRLYRLINSSDYRIKIVLFVRQQQCCASNGSNSAMAGRSGIFPGYPIQEPNREEQR